MDKKLDRGIARILNSKQPKPQPKGQDIDPKAPDYDSKVSFRVWL